MKLPSMHAQIKIKLENIQNGENNPKSPKDDK